MNIEYKVNAELKENDLKELFLSVEWDSGKYPEKLKTAMENCPYVVTAWDGEKLVGLINCMNDGIMTCYMHYVLVHKEYHSQGIGKNMMEMVKEEYKDYINLVLVANPEAVDFYKKTGFIAADDKTPMFITKVNL
ncbi:MAG: GNAT family N-acetyltransferase [Lachnospiraceae bacterium]|nr:GNAT family N-acetyltransferase [Lachnospiraceae bacterium]